MIRLSFDMSTIILLFAPFVVPKVIGWALQLLSTRQSAKNTPTPTASAGPGHQPKDQASLFRKRIRYLTAVVLCLRSLLAITWRRPFNIFTSLDDVPLTASISKLSSLLEWHQLSDQYGHLLPQLTSLDARLLYTHFGHHTFTRCQSLCKPNQPSEYFFYHALLLLKAYAIVAVLAGISNPRMRNWLGCATAAGFSGELYIVATTEMRTSSSGTANLADQLYTYRNIGVIALAAAALILPSTSAERQPQPLVIAFQREVQTLLEHQDQLQLRLRVLEAAKNVSYEGDEQASAPEASMPPEQAKALKAWLEKITSGEGSQGASRPPAVHPLVTTGHVSELVESAKTESAKTLVKQEPSIAAVKTEDDSEANKQDMQTEAVDSSSSSSMSSPLQTPTPANHPPPPFDIFASQIQKLTQANQHTSHDVSKNAGSITGSARENIFDQPKSILNESGASSSIEQLLHPVRYETAKRLEKDAEAGKELFGPEARRNTSPIALSISNNGSVQEQPPHDNEDRSDTPGSHGADSQSRSTSHGIADSASPPTPQGRKQIDKDDSGWITVTSKKVRQRYDPAI